MKRKISLGIFLMSVLMSISCAGASAQIEKFKAAYIFNFTRYIEWPETYNPNEFIIGMIGNNSELKAELENISAAKKVINKPIVVENYASESAVRDCNILFVCQDKSSRLNEIVQGLGNKNVLVVTESNGSISKGSAINFFINNNKLGFEIKTSNAQQKGLKVNSALEQLAAKKY